MQGHQRGPRSLWRGFERPVLLGVGILVVNACGPEDGAPPLMVTSSPRVDSSWVTGDARAALTATGAFSVQGPTERAYAQIDRPAATRLAAQWISRYGMQYSTLVSQDHGAPVDVPSLRPCPVGHAYAESPYADVASDVPPATRREYGPYWIVPLCTTLTEKVATLAVSAFAEESDAVPVPNGQRAVQLGNEYFVGGIPRSWGEFPISAEAAVQAVFGATHMRIVSPPVLVQRALPNAPQAALWRITTERPATIRAVSTAPTPPFAASELYVGNSRGRLRFFVASENQPANVELPSPVMIGSMRSRPQVAVEEAATTTVTRRVGFPLAFTEVTVQ